MNSCLFTCNPAFSRQLLKEIGFPGKVLHHGVIFVEKLSSLKNYMLAHEVYIVQNILNSLDTEKIVDTLSVQLSPDHSFALRCILYGSPESNVQSLQIRTRDIEVQVGTILERRGYIVNRKSPDLLFFLHVLSQKVYVSTLVYKVPRAVSFKTGRLNRAQLKLREASEFFQIPLDQIKTALDIGAAPGGFSKELSLHNVRVTALDPAELDSSLLLDSHITHIKKRAEEFAPSSQYDLFVNDMNMHPKDSARILLSLSSFLKNGGYCVMTVKCPSKNVFYYIEEVQKILEPSFHNFVFQHLPHNRMEIMMKAEKI